MTRFPADPDLPRNGSDEHKPCPWGSCQCTHVGCINGWVDKSDEEGDRTVPCPTCRPEVAAHLRRRDQSARRLRSDLPNLPRPSRHSKKDGPW